MNGSLKAWLLIGCGALGVCIAVALAQATRHADLAAPQSSSLAVVARVEPLPPTSSSLSQPLSVANPSPNAQANTIVRPSSSPAEAPLPPSGSYGGYPIVMQPEPRITGRAAIRVAAVPPGAAAPSAIGVDPASIQGAEQAGQMLNQYTPQQQQVLQNALDAVQSNPQMLQQVMEGKIPPGFPADAKQLLLNAAQNGAKQGAMAQTGVAAGVPAASQPNAGGDPAADAQQPAPAELPVPPGKTEFTLKSDVDGIQKVTLNMQDAKLRDVLDLLSEQAGLNILASANVEGRVTAVLNNVDVDDALDAILKSTGFISRREGAFLYVGTPKDFADLQIALDRVGTRVYRPNYVPAKELLTLLTPLLTPSVGKVSVTMPPSIGIAVNSNDAGGDAAAHGEAVLVTDYEAVLHQVDEVVHELDRRPMQVAIEAMVLSVTLNDTNQFGVNFQLLRDQQNVRFGINQPRINPLNGTGVPDGTTGGDTGQFNFTQGGLTFAFLDSSLGAFITALETIGDINVIAQPRLLCLNKQRAEILIGSQIPYTTSTVTQTFTTQTVQFLDIGTQLRLRPFISTDGSIRMEVHPEISSAGASVNNVPSKNVTQVTTNIMCYDGCTVIIGGLLEEDLQSNTTQVPFFGSLPYVGPLFRTKIDNIVRREILVLVTPRIVYTPDYEEESVKAQYDFERRQTSSRDGQTLLSRSHSARRFMARSQEAADAGDLIKARRYADMAVKFDPGNRAAIELRAELQGTPTLKHPEYLDRKIERTLRSAQPGPAPTGPVGPLGPMGVNPLDGEVVSPWLLDDLQGKPVNIPPLHPKDPGTPGYIRAISEREPQKK